MINSEQARRYGSLAIPMLMASLWVFSPSVCSADVLEEVIVTAQKREQSLQDIGISVTAFTGEQIRELGFTNTVDLVQMTPGFNYAVPQGDNSQVNFFLRGVGLNSSSDIIENPVGAYFDEVYRGAVGGLYLQMFDMERVEVLRGPQGTLYGRNTSGGLVHFISRQPTEDFEAYGELGFGSYDQIKFEGAVSGPIIPEKLLGRLSIATNNDSGWVENRFPGVGDYSETDSISGRLQLLWLPTDEISLLTKIHWSENDSQVAAWQHQTSLITDNGNDRRDVGPDENPYGTCPGCDALGYRDPDGDPFAGEYNRDGKVGIETSGASAKLTWDLSDQLQLVNIAAFDRTERFQKEDTDSGPNTFVHPLFEADTDQWSEELRLHGNTGRADWVMGFYYLNQEIDVHQELDLTTLGFILFDEHADQDTESWAVFGQLEYEFTPQWSAIVGLRYTEEERTLDFSNFERSGLYASLTGAGAIPLTPTRPVPDAAMVFNRQTAGDLAEHDKSNVTGKVELDFRPNDDWLVYASFSRGVKSAAFNSGFLDETGIFAANTPQTVPFDQEKINAYELGFKGVLLDGIARLNAAVYYYDYMDFQTLRFELLNQFLFNSDAEVYGGELELQLSPSENWDFAFGLALMDATAKDVTAPNFPTTGLVRDRTMVAAPDVTFNGLARYQWPAFAGTMAALAKFHYQSETFYDIQNYSNAREDGYVVGDVRLEWASQDDRWRLALFVNNIADEEYITYTFDFAGALGFNQVAYGKPRWYGGSIMYRWN
jgi:iron complex outermembrane receptor protein